jgi:hypothetical protein
MRSDSVKRHLPIEYAADLTPVVAGKEAGASWNALGMAEIACKLECAVGFCESQGIRRQGVRADTRKDCYRRPRAAEINWYSGKER